MKPRIVSELSRSELPNGESLVQVNGHSRALIVNALGDAVIDLCDGSRTIAEIADIIRAALNVPANIDVEADVARLIAELQDAGVVQAP